MIKLQPKLTTKDLQLSTSNQGFKKSLQIKVFGVISRNATKLLHVITYNLAGNHFH